MVRRPATSVMTLILLLTGLTSLALGQAVTAFVDRNALQMDDTVQLTIAVSDPDPGISPNLTSLEKDFDMLGTVQRTQTSIMNGQTTTTTEWVTTLAPKRIGNLVIPPIQMGAHHTVPITLTVLSSQQAGQDKTNRDIFLETTVEPEDSYIQSQVLYTVRLYYGVPLRDGRIGDPSIPDARVTRLGDDRSVETIRDGRRYQIIERTFSLIPQKSGVLTIPSLVFNGNVPTRQPRQSLLNDLFQNQSGAFSMDPFDGLFQSTRPVRTRSQSLTINVRPIPPSMMGQPWLPAKALSLREDWVPALDEGQNALRVGEPVTRTILVQATGLTGPQLPEISMTDQAQFKIYPDQPTLDTQYDGTMAVGVREQKLAFVPTQEGPVHLPAIHIPWWNVNDHKQEIAMLPARTLTVLPESGTSSEPPPIEPQHVTLMPSASSDRVSSTQGIEEHDVSLSPSFPFFWQGVAGVFFLCWLITGVGWLSDRRTRATQRQSKRASTRFCSERDALAAFRQACKENDPGKARSTLIAWAQIKWPSSFFPQGLGTLARHATHIDMKEAIWNLDQMLYGSLSQEWDGPRFYHLVVSTLTNTDRETRSHKDVLEPLFLA